MYDKHLEILLKDPVTVSLILWLGFGLISLWGVISLFVVILPMEPQSWIGKKLNSSGIKYSENRNLKIIYILYSVISLAFSWKMNGIFIFLSEAILILNIAIICAISIAKRESMLKKSNQFDSEPE